MVFPHGLRALNHPPFRAFFLAQLVALVGTWMQTVSQAWLVLQLTDSPFKLGLLGSLQFGPILLFSPLAGVLADRWPRRRLLVLTQAALACQAWALALLVATGRARYWQIALLALVTGLANTLDAPVRQSFVMGLVGRENLVNAVALNSASFNAARIVGPAVAGLLIARFGVVPAFVVNGAGFLVVLTTLLRQADDPPGRRAPDASIRRDIAEALRYVRRTPRVRALLGILFVLGLCVFNFTVYVPLLARTVLGLGPEGFGFLMAALGVGAIVGALAIGARADAEPPMAVLLGAAAVACAGLVGLSAVRAPWTAVPLLFVTGFAGIVTVTGCNTTMQLSAPDELRGRVMSLYAWVYGGVFPIGSFLIGATSERHGVSAALLLNGTLGLGLLAALAATRAWRAPAGRSRPRS
ncbi:MAG TPA: MFS transporter [Methylomirabilota bacterium]|jgi:predicted MFS family arabinose efflux permease|nr:MFS transporter [Methylomirabilota bacterium]